MNMNWLIVSDGVVCINFKLLVCVFYKGKIYSRILSIMVSVKEK